MASRHIFPSTRRAFMLRGYNHRLHRSFATTGPADHLYEYVVIIHDKSAARRPAQTPMTPPSLQKLSFVGNILGKSPEDIRGDVLACQAASQDEIQSKLKDHPFAKDVWDMNKVFIWPFETVHNIPTEGEKA